MTPLPQQPPAAPRPRASLLTAICLAAGVLAGGCDAPLDETPPGTLRVVVSIEPLAMILHEIAGDLVRVRTLLPAGADPHHYEARPRKIAELARADLIVSVGGGFDGWADALCVTCKNSARRLRLVDLPGIEARRSGHDHHGHDDHREGALDPHVWLDPIRVRDVIAPALADEIGLLAPHHRKGLQQRLSRFIDSLSEIDRDVRALFADRHPRFVALHPAWHYFAARYALDQRAVLAPTSGVQPSAKQIAHTIRACRAEAIETLVLEATDSKRLGAAIAEALGIDAVTLDPLGVPAAPGTIARQRGNRARLADLYRGNAQRLAAALPRKVELAP